MLYSMRTSDSPFSHDKRPQSPALFSSGPKMAKSTPKSWKTLAVARAVSCPRGDRKDQTPETKGRLWVEDLEPECELAHLLSSPTPPAFFQTLPSDCHNGKLFSTAFCNSAGTWGRRKTVCSLISGRSISVRSDIPRALLHAGITVHTLQKAVRPEDFFQLA